MGNWPPNLGKLTWALPPWGIVPARTSYVGSLRQGFSGPCYSVATVHWDLEDTVEDGVH